jgi:hypothetical protein
MLGSAGVETAGSLRIETFEGKPLAFRANAGHYWNLNRYSTGSNELQGSIVSIPNMEHRPEEIPVLHRECKGRRERPDQQTRAASALRAASFKLRSVYVCSGRMDGHSENGLCFHLDGVREIPTARPFDHELRRADSCGSRPSPRSPAGRPIGRPHRYGDAGTAH